MDNINKSYQLGRWALYVESVTTWKSLKLRKKWKAGVLAGWTEPCSILIVSIWARKSIRPYSLDKNKAKSNQLGRRSSPKEVFRGWKSLKLSTMWKRAKMVFGKNTHIQWVEFKILFFSPRLRMEICSNSPYLPKKIFWPI